MCLWPFLTCFNRLLGCNDDPVTPIPTGLQNSPATHLLQISKFGDRILGSFHTALLLFHCSAPLVFVWVTSTLLWTSIRLGIFWCVFWKITKIWVCCAMGKPQWSSVYKALGSQKKWHSMYLSERAHSRGHTYQNTGGFLPRKQRWSVQPAF